MADPLTMALVSAGGGLISGLLGMGDSPRDEALQKIMGQLNQYLEKAGQVPLSASELAAMTSQQKRELATAGDVAASQIGAELTEAGSDATGQDFAQYFTQAVAPIKAQGIQAGVQIEESDKDRIISQEEKALNRELSTLTAMLTGAGAQPGMNKSQRFFTGFTSGADLFASGFGNLASAYKDFNYEPVQPDGGG